MSEQVEKTTDAVQPLLDKLTEYLSAAEKVVVEHAPDVWQATLCVIQAKAIFSLVGWSVLTVLVVLATRWSISKTRAELKKNWSDQNDFIIVGPNIVCGVAALVLALGWVGSFNWWLGAFAPELSVLYGIASKFGIL